MNTRITSILLSLAAFTLTSDVFEDLNDRINYHNENRVWIKTYIKYATDKGSKDEIKRTRAPVIGKYVLLTHHATTDYQEESKVASNQPSQQTKVISQKSFIDGVPIKEVHRNPNTDMAIFELTGDLCKQYCNYSKALEDLVPKEELEIGQEVWWVGDPGYRGERYRESRIASLNPENAQGIFKKAYLVEDRTAKGSSGSPVYNENNQLVGILQGVGGFRILGYVIWRGPAVIKPMDEYMEFLKANTKRTVN